MGAGRGDFAAVESALRSRSFGTLSTLSEQGRPHATGVVYAVSPPAAALALYVTTRSTTRKVRNIRARADVAFVVPVPRRLLKIFPPSAIQFQGTAEVLSHDDHEAVRGVDVGEIRCSAHNEFFWFHDLDGNSFELSRPLRLSS